jgi:hypothetical protein
MSSVFLYTGPFAFLSGYLGTNGKLYHAPTSALSDFTETSQFNYYNLATVNLNCLH